MMKGEGKQGAQEPKTLAPQGVQTLMESEVCKVGQKPKPSNQ